MDQEVKYHAPSNLATHAPYLNIWIAKLEDGKKMWIQTSKDEKDPKWRRMGDFLEERIMEKYNADVLHFIWELIEETK